MSSRTNRLSFRELVEYMECPMKFLLRRTLQEDPYRPIEYRHYISAVVKDLMNNVLDDVHYDRAPSIPKYLERFNESLDSAPDNVIVPKRADAVKQVNDIYRTYLSNFIQLMTGGAIKVVSRDTTHSVVIGSLIFQVTVPLGIQIPNSTNTYWCKTHMSTKTIDISRFRLDPDMIVYHRLAEQNRLQNVVPSILDPGTKKLHEHQATGTQIQAAIRNLDQAAESLMQGVDFARYGFWCDGCDFKSICYNPSDLDKAIGRYRKLNNPDRK